MSGWDDDDDIFFEDGILEGTIPNIVKDIDGLNIADSKQRQSHLQNAGYRDRKQAMETIITQEGFDEGFDKGIVLGKLLGKFYAKIKILFLNDQSGQNLVAYVENTIFVKVTEAQLIAHDSCDTIISDFVKGMESFLKSQGDISSDKKREISILVEEVKASRITFECGRHIY